MIVMVTAVVMVAVMMLAGGVPVCSIFQFARVLGEQQ